MHVGAFEKKIVKTALIWLFGRSMQAICGSSWTWWVNVTPPQTYDVKHIVLFLIMCSWCCVFEQNQTDSRDNVLNLEKDSRR